MSELDISLSGPVLPMVGPAHVSSSPSSFTAEKEALNQEDSAQPMESGQDNPSLKAEHKKSEQDMPSLEQLVKDLQQMAESPYSGMSPKAEDGKPEQAVPNPEESLQDPEPTANNQSLLMLTAEYKKPSHQLVSDEFQRMEEEASRRMKARENEIQQMLQSRRKVVDGDSSALEQTETILAPKLSPVTPRRSQVLLMTSKWEQGLRGEEEPGPSILLTPIVSQHSQVQLMKAKWEQGPPEEVLPTVTVTHPIPSEHSQVQLIKSSLEQRLTDKVEVVPSLSAPSTISIVTTTTPTLTTITKTVQAVSTPQPTAQLLPPDELERKVLRESLARESRKILIKRPSLFSEDSEVASLSSSSGVSL